jgi:hypothetical protein
MARISYTHAYPLAGGNKITRNGIAAHSTLVLFMAGNYTAAPTTTILSSSLGNTWYRQSVYKNPDWSVGVVCWVCFDSAAGNETVTFSNPGPDGVATMVEIGGLDNAAITVDAQVAGTGLTSPSFSPSAVGYVVAYWANYYSSSVSGQGANYSLIEHDSNWYEACEDRWDAPSGAQTASFAGTANGGDCVYVIALKKAGGGGGTNYNDSVSVGGTAGVAQAAKLAGVNAVTIAGSAGAAVASALAAIGAATLGASAGASGSGQLAVAGSATLGGAAGAGEGDQLAGAAGVTVGGTAGAEGTGQLAGNNSATLAAAAEAAGSAGLAAGEVASLGVSAETSGTGVLDGQNAATLAASSGFTPASQLGALASALLALRSAVAESGQLGVSAAVVLAAQGEVAAQYDAGAGYAESIELGVTAEVTSVSALDAQGIIEIGTVLGVSISSRSAMLASVALQAAAQVGSESVAEIYEAVVAALQVAIAAEAASGFSESLTLGTVAGITQADARDCPLGIALGMEAGVDARAQLAGASAVIVSARLTVLASASGGLLIIRPCVFMGRLSAAPRVAQLSAASRIVARLYAAPRILETHPL